MALDVPSVVVTMGEPSPPSLEHQATVAVKPLALVAIFTATKLPPGLGAPGQATPRPPSIWQATHVPRLVVYTAGAPLISLVATDCLKSSVPIPPRLSRSSRYRLWSLPPAATRCGFDALGMSKRTSLAPPRSVSELSR